MNDISVKHDVNIVSHNLKKEREYWNKCFSNGVNPSAIEPDYIPDINLENDVELEFSHTFSTQISNRFFQLANNSDFRLQVIVHSVLAAFLNKYGGNSDSTLGTTIHRQKVKGNFMNTVLPIRLRIDENMTYKSLLKKSFEILNESIKHQNYPIETLINDLNLKISKDTFPLFDIAVILDNIQDLEYIKHLPINLVFVFHSTHDAVKLNVHYSSNKYKTSTVKRIVELFDDFIEKVIFNVDTPLTQLSILSRHELKLVYHEFNNINHEYDSSKNIVECFSEQVKRTPNAIALVYDDKTLTYKELDNLSNKLAHLLEKKNQVSGKIIGILLDRSIEMLVAIFGILKSGSAYLPLPIKSPDHRISYMVKDSNIELILTSVDHSSRIKQLCGYIELEESEINKISKLKNSNKREISSSNPIYVIYTSGSTGNAKGVILEHKNVHNLVQGLKNRIYRNYNSYLKIAFLAPYEFDASVQQIFGSLLQGHGLVIVPEDVRLAGPQIVKYFEKNCIDISDGTPSHLRIITDSVSENQKLCIKHFIIAGEVLPKNLVEKFFELFGPKKTKLTNLYGPTETCVDSTLFNVEKNVLDDYRSIPIGSPLDNQKVYILDKYDQFVPIGIKGEINIIGDGVARGYLNNVQLTHEKFNNFKNSKRYRTGDVARWLPKGVIDYIGREDSQIKIKGYRVELEEIEHHIKCYEGIINSVVSARKNSQGNMYLCAYLIKETQISVEDIRKYLLSKLPDYMVPYHFMPISSLPLLPNGKINRKSLPDPQDNLLEKSTEYQPPSSKIEKELVKIWEQVLGNSKIGILDDYFTLGGDSIRAIQISSRMNNLGFKVEIRDIFSKSNIKSLAPLVTNLEVAISQVPVTGKVELTPIQKWYFELTDIDIHHYNHGVMLFSKDRLDVDGLNKVFQKLFKHHDALRLIYNISEDNVVSQVNKGIELKPIIEKYDLLNLENPLEELKQISNKVHTNINLKEGPLFKIAVFNMLDGDRMLLITHHLIMDGISMRILFEDIENLYSNHKKGERLELPKKTDSFQKWAEVLWRKANSNIIASEIDYWAHIERTPIPQIPKDFDDGVNLRKDREMVTGTLSTEYSKSLLTGFNNIYGTEINDILITVLAVTLRDLFDFDKIKIDMESHGRENIDDSLNFSRTIGWFTSLFPVMVNISKTKDWSVILIDIKETIRNIPDRGINYGMLKYLRNEDNVLKSASKSQISFNYLGQFNQDIKNMSFEIAREESGIPRSTDRPAEHEIDFIAISSDDKFDFSFYYNNRQYKKETFERIVNQYNNNLRDLIDYSNKLKDRIYSPSDFLKNDISLPQLRKFEKQFEIKDIYPLTPMQKGKLFHFLYDKNVSACFVQTSYILQGIIDITLMKKSLDILFERYDMLRSAIIHEDVDEPLQIILKERESELFYEKVELHNEEEKEQYINNVKSKDRLRSFNLTHEALMRISVIEFGNDEYGFIWSHNHIIMDGWCTGILIADFFEIYNSFRRNKEYELSEVTPFGEYIGWLNKNIKQDISDYWKQYLDGFEYQTSLPQRPKSLNTKTSLDDIEHLELEISLEKSKALNILAQQHKVTLNTIIQSIWAVILSELNEQNDVVFGAVVSGRPSRIKGIETMVGVFMNTVPVRVLFSRESLFIDLIKEVSEKALKSEPYQNSPLSVIQSNSVLKNNLLDHIVVFENYPLASQLDFAVNNTDKNIEEQPFEVINSNVFAYPDYNMHLIVEPIDEITFCFKFNKQVYEIGTANKVLESIEGIIDQIVANKNSTINDLCLRVRNKFMLKQQLNRNKNEFNF